MNAYLAEDGLMKLTVDDNREPFPGAALKTVANDNGIYYLAIYYLLRVLKGDWFTLDERLEVGSAIERLRKSDGLFLRHAGDERTDAQDNYLGICILSVLFNFPFAKEILDYGSKHGFNYDHTGKGGATTMRQGGEICFYRVCCGYAPPVWEWVWFLSGVLVNAFTKQSNMPSDAQLAWARLELVNRMRITGLFGLSFTFVRWIWRLRAKKRFGSIYQIFHRFYLDSEHPIRALAIKVER